MQFVFVRISVTVRCLEIDSTAGFERDKCDGYKDS